LEHLGPAEGEEPFPPRKVSLLGAVLGAAEGLLVGAASGDAAVGAFGATCGWLYGLGCALAVWRVRHRTSRLVARLLGVAVVEAVGCLMVAVMVTQMGRGQRLGLLYFLAVLVPTCLVSLVRDPWRLHRARRPESDAGRGAVDIGSVAVAADWVYSFEQEYLFLGDRWMRGPRTEGLWAVWIAPEDFERLGLRPDDRTTLWAGDYPEAAVTYRGHTFEDARRFVVLQFDDR